MPCNRTGGVLGPVLRLTTRTCADHGAATVRRHSTRGDGVPGPRLSVIVLAWNNLHLTQACVASLRATTEVPYELIVVDNGSQDGTADWARDAADVPVLLPENLGFARGMNAGLQAASGDAVAFVNNDTVWPGGWALPLLEQLDDPSIGIVAPAVTAAGNPVTVRDAPGHDVIRFDPFAELPSGVAYVMRTSDARALGGFDERYRLAMSEDLDLLFTCWVNGLDVVLDTRVLVEHELHASLEQLEEERASLWRDNLDVFLERWTTVQPQDVARLPRTATELIERNCRHARAAATWLARQDRIRSELHDAQEQRVQRIRDRCDERLDELRTQIRELRAAEHSGPLRRLAHRLRG